MKNPNPTEKQIREAIKKSNDEQYETFHGHKRPTPPVESWRKEFRKEFGFIGHKGIQCDEITVANLEAFISSQIQQAEERLVEKIKKEYNKRYQKIAKEHGLKRKTPHTMFHDVLATLKEEKDL